MLMIFNSLNPAITAGKTQHPLQVIQFFWYYFRLCEDVQQVDDTVLPQDLHSCGSKMNDGDGKETGT